MCPERNLPGDLQRVLSGVTLRGIGDCAGGLNYKMVGKVIRAYAEMKLVMLRRFSIACTTLS